MDNVEETIQRQIQHVLDQHDTTQDDTTQDDTTQDHKVDYSQIVIPFPTNRRAHYHEKKYTLLYQESLLAFPLTNFQTDYALDENREYQMILLEIDQQMDRWVQMVNLPLQDDHSFFDPRLLYKKWPQWARQFLFQKGIFAEEAVRSYRWTYSELIINVQKLQHAAITQQQVSGQQVSGQQVDLQLWDRMKVEPYAKIQILLKAVTNSALIIQAAIAEWVQHSKRK